MVARKIQTAFVPKAHYADYLGKARQFQGVMLMSLEDQEWDSVLLLGVHAAISATDALLVFHAGRRSISQAHRDAVTLLLQSLPDREDVRQNANRLSLLLNEKHAVEYEPRRFTEKEALEFSKKVERYFDWVLKQLPTPP